MDCNDARFYLRFRHPGPDDLGPEVTADLDRHLADCPRCASEAAANRRFDAAVGRAMRDVPVPAGLRAKLITDLSARRGNVLRRKAYRYAAIAASLLLAVGIIAGVFSAARPTLDTDSLVQIADERLDAPAAAAAVREWLAAEHLPANLPEPFDFNLYLTHGTEAVQGRAVPVVVFRHPQSAGFAKVYAFRDGQFKLKDVKDAQASRCQAIAYPPDRATGVTFVVVYTGDSLDPFKRVGGFTRRAGIMTPVH